MDTLVTTRKERFWHPDAWSRDQWVRAQAAQLPPGSRVLDAGAGASKYRPLFAHCRYETQDFCQYQGPLVKYTQPIDHVCDITKVPLPDASLDAILCTEVFEHVVDPMAVLAEFGRLLKPGGKLLLTAPMSSNGHMEPYHFYGGFTHYWYRHWLPERGFRVDSITPSGGPGRACISYLHNFWMSWRAWEKRLPAPRRLLSLAVRMLFKIPVHYVFPWALYRLDQHLDGYQSCAGFMVVGTRIGEVRDNGGAREEIRGPKSEARGA